MGWLRVRVRARRVDAHERPAARWLVAAPLTDLVRVRALTPALTLTLTLSLTLTLTLTLTW